MMRLYRFLLRLYPARLVDEFEEEITAVLTDLQSGIRSEGIAVRLRFVLREVSGLLTGAVREHLDIRNRNLSGGSMRYFRFPRWTIVMMVLMFCAVNTAIEKGRLASVQLLGGQGTSHWWALPGVFLSVFAFLAVVGCVGYCILHVVRTIRGTGV
jgi:hypothetical protein